MGRLANFSPDFCNVFKTSFCVFHPAIQRTPSQRRTGYEDRRVPPPRPKPWPQKTKPTAALSTTAASSHGPQLPQLLRRRPALLEVTTRRGSPSQHLPEAVAAREQGELPVRYELRVQRPAAEGGVAGGMVDFVGLCMANG